MLADGSIKMDELRKIQKNTRSALVMMCVAMAVYAVGNILTVCGEIFIAAVPEAIISAIASVVYLIPIFNALFIMVAAPAETVIMLIPALVGGLWSITVQAVSLIFFVISFVLGVTNTIAAKKAALGVESTGTVAVFKNMQTISAVTSVASAVLAAASLIKPLLDVGEYLVIYVIKPILVVIAYFLVWGVGSAVVNAA